MADEEAEDIGLFENGHHVFVKTRSRLSPPERFWRRVEIVGQCWEWTGGLAGGGYGHFMYRANGLDYRQVPSHRFSWELLYGPIPSGLLVCHTCDNKRCVRPSHLWLGTDQDNADDKMRKGRANLESRTWPKRRRGARLSIEIAEDIRRRVGMGQRRSVVASEFGISLALISLIVNGKRWMRDG